ncbi:protein of unknown function [Pseudoxanthomonas sp. GM95]|nr:protein of unknown function [Pseudoxanthomonas sp. GM95]
MVTDKLGSDHALQLPGRHIFVFPRSMLLKRIGRGERPDGIDLVFMLGEISHAVEAQAAGAARGDA